MAPSENRRISETHSP